MSNHQDVGTAVRAAEPSSTLALDAHKTGTIPPQNERGDCSQCEGAGIWLKWDYGCFIVHRCPCGGCR